MNNKLSDFVFTDQGSMWGVRAQTKAAREFANENLEVEPWMGRPTSFHTDHRPARDLFRALMDDGWAVEYRVGGFANV